MRTFDNVAALAAAVGENLGTSEWHTITQEQINTFADATGDHQWIHVDPERAAKGPFGTTIAHGFLTLSLLPGLLEQTYEVKNLALGLNYGTNRVRFPSPVPVDSKIRVHAELTEAKPISFGTQFVIRATIEREGADKPVCIADVISVLADEE